MKRYDLCQYSHLEDDQTGEYVLFSDVEPLLAEVERLRRFRDAAVPVCEYVRSERDGRPIGENSRAALAILENAP